MTYSSAVLAAVTTLAACGSSEPTTPSAEPSPAPSTAPESESEPAPRTAVGPSMDVAAWQALLDDFVTEDGGFRYAALRGDETRRAQLAEVVAAVGSADPSAYADDAKLAFYINAYNALTVSAVVERWPLESVMRIEGFFDRIEHRVAGESMTLNHLENEIIRARFEEPRIHFAVNCASAGCPPLSPTAFTPANLEAQLVAQTQAYVRRTSRIDRDGGRVELSQIFEWFAADFEPAGGVRTFVANHLEGDNATFVRHEGTALAHFEYDWAVNARD